MTRRRSRQAIERALERSWLLVPGATGVALSLIYAVTLLWLVAKSFEGVPATLAMHVLLAPLATLAGQLLTLALARTLLASQPLVAGLLSVLALVVAGPGAGLSRWLLLAAITAGVLTPPAFFLARRRLRGIATITVVSAATIFVVILGLVPTNMEANELGLAAGGISKEMTVDYSDNAAKDNYPVCRYITNSLGYRAPEPGPRDDRFRVLLVGDSYVWGDGIPTYEGTLPAKLAGALEERAPGRFEVTAAGVPGNGLYGYARSVEALGPRLSPDAVVVVLLGEPDLDPFDVQRIYESVPQTGFLRNIAINLGAAQRLHEQSVRTGGSFWTTPEALALAKGHLDLLSEAAEAQGASAVVLQFFPWSRPEVRLPPPEGVTWLEVPEELRYPGHSSPLWYAKDMHPKPPLNERVAALLADVLIEKASATR